MIYISGWLRIEHLVYFGGVLDMKVAFVSQCVVGTEIWCVDVDTVYSILQRATPSFSLNEWMLSSVNITGKTKYQKLVAQKMP